MKDAGNTVESRARVNAKAFQQARSRLEIAKRAVEDLNSETPLKPGKFEDAWIAFLGAAATVYSKLQQGAKSNRQSMVWFDRIKSERRSDELLRYLHHARNAEEHTVETSTRILRRRVPVFESTDNYEVVRSEHGVSRGEAELRILKPPEGGKLLLRTKLVSVAGIQLATVKDRGVYYDPPKTHLGANLADRSPRGVANAGLNYLTKLIDEADDLARSL